jgi:hypothetical protein
MFHALLVFLSELKETISETVKYLFSKPFGRVPTLSFYSVAITFEWN